VRTARQKYGDTTTRRRVDSYLCSLVAKVTVVHAKQRRAKVREPTALGKHRIHAVTRECREPEPRQAVWDGGAARRCTSSRGRHPAQQAVGAYAVVRVVTATRRPRIGRRTVVSARRRAAANAAASRQRRRGDGTIAVRPRRQHRRRQQLGRLRIGLLTQHGDTLRLGHEVLDGHTLVLILGLRALRQPRHDTGSEARCEFGATTWERPHAHTRRQAFGHTYNSDCTMHNTRKRTMSV
jgi:hypothetical protein